MRTPLLGPSAWRFLGLLTRGFLQLAIAPYGPSSSFRARHRPGLATVTVPLDRWSRSYPRAAVAPAMGSLREANFTKDLTANGKSPTL